MAHHRGATGLRTALAACVAAGLAACFAGFAAAASLPVAPQRLVAISRADSVPPLTCTVPATADTYVDENTGGGNFGTQADLRVAIRTNQVKRTYLRFDLSSCAIPTTAVVQAASMRLVMSTAPGSSRSYAVHRLTSAWAENTLTWVSQPSASGTPTSTVSAGTAVGPLSWNVATDVQAQVATPSSNHGWVLRDTGEGSSSQIEAAFRSRENATVADRPSLQVTYYR